MKTKQMIFDQDHESKQNEFKAIFENKLPQYFHELKKPWKFSTNRFLNF